MELPEIVFVVPPTFDTELVGTIEAPVLLPDVGTTVFTYPDGKIVAVDDTVLFVDADDRDVAGYTGCTSVFAPEAVYI